MSEVNRENMSSEQLDEEIRRHEAAILVMQPCPHCYTPPVIIRRTDAGLPMVVGRDHEKGCPDHVPE